MMNPALEKLLAEQKGCKMFEFKVRVENAGYRRTMTIYANTAFYARKMAAVQREPGDTIVWVKYRSSERSN